jgi:DNA polymerase-3 subunit epsilon
MPDFLGFIKNTIIGAHNAPFDCGFINENLARLYNKGCVPFRCLPNKTVDTLVLSRRLFPGFPRHNLQDLALSLGLQAEEAHRALDDARLCMEIFVRCSFL